MNSNLAWEGVKPNIINRFVLNVDESLSMKGLAPVTIRVFDNFIQHLAVQSQGNGQETRVTVYLFNSYGTARCVIWDMDVLRVPSLVGRYSPRGNTSLLQTYLKSVREVREIPLRYGDNSAFFAMFSDGQENDSVTPHNNHAARAGLVRDLNEVIATAPVSETHAFFAPDQTGVHHAKQYGFPAANISVWDPTSAEGMEQAGMVLREAADFYMQARAQGIQGFSPQSGHSGLFKLRDFTAADVTSVLAPMTPGTYVHLSVPCDTPIKEFVESAGLGPYVPRAGKAFYQLTKAVKVQSYKHVIVEHGDRFYTGDQARQLLGLPSQDVTVQPAQKPGMTIFFQSTSPNRKLIGGTRLVVMR